MKIAPAQFQYLLEVLLSQYKLPEEDRKHYRSLTIAQPSSDTHVNYVFERLFIINDMLFDTYLRR